MKYTYLNKLHVLEKSFCIYKPFKIFIQFTFKMENLFYILGIHFLKYSTVGILNANRKVFYLALDIGV